jgi:hypothetical protein
MSSPVMATDLSAATVPTAPLAAFPVNATVTDVPPTLGSAANGVSANADIPNIIYAARPRSN